VDRTLNFLLEKAEGQEMGNDAKRRTRWGVYSQEYRRAHKLVMSAVESRLDIKGLEIYFLKKDYFNGLIRYQRMGDGADIEIEFRFGVLASVDDYCQFDSVDFTGIWLMDFERLSSDLQSRLISRIGLYPNPCTWSGLLITDSVILA
jgi:hypothetical protein